MSVVGERVGGSYPSTAGHRLQHWALADICSHKASLMLAHHLQPWLNSKTALAKHLIFAGGTGNLIH